MKRIASLALGCVLALGLSACGSSTPEAAPKDGKPAAKAVKFGIMPYFDYAPWDLAQEQGFFAAEGIEYTPTLFPVEGNMAPALVNGSVDVGAFSDTAAVNLAGQFPKLRMVGFQNVFTGFAIMTRKGAFATYEENLAKEGDPDKAAIATISQLKGKTIVTTSGAAFSMVIDQALQKAGMAKGDLKIADFEPDTGVAAFQRGTGDVFLGGLPQRQRLTELGNVALISGDQIGPGAIALSGLAANADFAAANPEVLAALQRVWFKTMAYMDANADKANTFIAEWANKKNGASNKAADVAAFYKDFVKLAKTPAEAREMFYAEGAPNNWKTRIDYLISYGEADKSLKPGSVRADELVIAADVMNKVG
ncbi:ABC transporter substrate-binding protein [Rhizohabitans arisaemae]|uniref:ABC transporter substrate-binding protein n=1 Tax=Rhizohabitans arisaemae TaxID=2720610 RepID=UPI0024B19928|nr:ABC transporter substrate-binding protein [Rhizohabitans arisaemae]